MIGQYFFLIKIVLPKDFLSNDVSFFYFIL